MYMTFNFNEIQHVYPQINFLKMNCIPLYVFSKDYFVYFIHEIIVNLNLTRNIAEISPTN